MTGVQTCALPIFEQPRHALLAVNGPGGAPEERGSFGDDPAARPIGIQRLERELDLPCPSAHAGSLDRGMHVHSDEGAESESVEREQ